LEDVQTKLTGGVNIWVKHLTEKLDRRRLVWVLFFEAHNKSKGSVLEGSVGRSDDNSVPAALKLASLMQDMLG
jgi:hypothetical protein